MLKNILIVALRNLKKDGWYSLLNILGLTMGITFSLFLIFYVRDELSFDRYNVKADRIYRINSYIHERDKNTDWAITQMPLASTLKREFPEVEDAVRFLGRERTLFENGDKKFYETGVYYADSTVFNIFTYKFLEGDPAHALVAPNSIVISKTQADKFFGDDVSAVGKTLRTVYDVYTVTGVIQDVPQNSHIRFDMLISMTSLPMDRINNDNWGNFNNYTYVLLRPGASAAGFDKKLEPMYKKYMAPIFAQFNVTIQYKAQPITAIHLHSKLQMEPEELGSMSYIWIFSAVAFLMLLVACINYMNLTTARSARRAKEIGIRKVTGSSKGQLIWQFLIESLLTSLAAILVSFGLVILLLPSFDGISGKYFTIHTLLQPSNLGLLAGIWLFTGLVGGSYPAFYLSGFRPVSILKGSLSKASGNINLRRSLVVLQFSVAMVMLICTWVVYAQLSYVQKRNLGFNKAQVMTLIVNTGEDERSKIDAMDNELRSLPEVADVGTGNSYPGSSNLNLNLFVVQTRNGNVNKGINCYTIDEHFLQTLGIHIVKGRNFTGPADTMHSILVNEAMVKHFGWNDPIGKRVNFPGDTSGHYLEVVGVFNDFNQKSLYNPIDPLLLFYGSDGNNIQIKVRPGDIQQSIAQVGSIWKKYFPQLPYEYKFLDKQFNSQYDADQKRGKIFATFSILTILITFMGLLGLTAFTTQQRQKEISIRRVLGSDIYGIVSIISRGYLWLALIAALIAFPVAYYFMDNWLKVFSYNTGLSPLPFVLSALVIVLTALATAAFYSSRAAMSNPATNLRTE
ncbi:MAG: ABC transporter permease [Bacteroidota bacterium]|nr:ABC transporter permease [Bacteroidota bacterium]